MRELALFAGAGGGLLGTHGLLGWDCVGYVEKDDYCQRVIAQRIKDGLQPNAPIFGDVRAFISAGYAGSYPGMVDVVTAGFPCQPFSVAGQRKGEADERNLWPETIECIRVVGPRFALLENVPGLLRHEYFGTILGDLAESGFDVTWAVLPAYITGAPQVGARLWLVAAADGERLEGLHATGRGKHLRPIEADVPREFWQTLPRVYRAGHGMAYRVERTESIGNGQVPAVVRAAWELLSGE